MNAPFIPIRAQSYEDQLAQRIEESRPADWPPVSPYDEAPIVYRDMHIHFGHESGVYVICLGEMIWAATWPELKSEIDRRLSTDRICAGDNLAPLSVERMVLR